ncbi:MAG: hypothetical protein JXA07_04050 [Spirochaetes bacterium]|nr:hypothetical protein [Spirochaetota bacterium]
MKKLIITIALLLIICGVAIADSGYRYAIYMDHGSAYDGETLYFKDRESAEKYYNDKRERWGWDADDLIVYEVKEMKMVKRSVERIEWCIDDEYLQKYENGEAPYIIDFEKDPYVIDPMGKDPKEVEQ